jgi:hypothetical protein
MTTITIEQSLLEQALNALLLPCDRWNKQQFLIVKGAIEALNAALAAPATAPEELERLRQIAHLIGTIFCYGHFVAETHNERVLEKLLRENGTFWESVEQYEREQGRM